MRTMRVRIMCCSALLAALSAGCTLPGATCSTGWRYEIMKPATVTAPASPVVVQGGTGPLSLGPISSTAAVAARGALLAAEAPCAPPAAPHALLAAQPDCTMQRLCDTLDRIERRLNAERIAAPLSGGPRPLPPGPPQ